MRTRKYTSSTKFTPNNQAGLVSFFVTIILMMVITLIMVGFTQLAVRNREDALDKQLSTQAFYAAETGINDTVKKLRELYIANASTPNYIPPKKETCKDPSVYDLPVADKKLTADDAVKYTCVLVTPNSEWIQTSAGTNESKVVLIEPVDSNGNTTDLRDLNFTWKKTTTGSYTDCPASGSAYVPDLGTCPYGLLRVDLYKDVGAVTPDTMRNTVKSFYFMPTSASVLWTTASAGDDPVYRAGSNCTEVECTAHVIFDEPEPAPGTRTIYYARISSIYRDIDKVTITGRQLVPGWGIFAFSFRGQTLIDVTGKAYDVTRRVQAQVATEQFNTSFTPSAAIHSGGDFCKRFVVFPGYTEDRCVN